MEATPLHGVGGKSDLYNGVDAQTVFPHFSERDSFVELSFIYVFHGDGIVSSKIYIQWNDEPKMEVVLHEMSEGLAESFDRWLAMIEDEENAKLGL